MGNFFGAERKEKMKRFAHLLSGALILIHGIDRFEESRAMWPVFIGAGSVFILLAVFHRQLTAKWSGIDSLFFLIEAMLCITIMFEFMDAGKRGLPFMYLIAAIAQVCGALITWRKRKLAKLKPH